MKEGKKEKPVAEMQKGTEVMMKRAKNKTKTGAIKGTWKRERGEWKHGETKR